MQRQSAAVGQAHLTASTLQSAREHKQARIRGTFRRTRNQRAGSQEHASLNRAELGAPGPRQTSAEGFELRFTVNYLAGFLLTLLMLPLVKNSTPARIVNVSSAGQQPIDFDDVMLTGGYSGARAYCQSKLAQIMFTIELAAAL